MSKPAKQKYKTTNWATYNRALKARGSLTVWLDWQAPDYSTMSRREKRLQVQITARPSRGGLHLLVDSTGIKMLGEGEWKTRKHGAEYRRQWRKVHLGIDAETLEIRAIEVTDNRVGEGPRR